MEKKNRERTRLFSRSYYLRAQPRPQGLLGVQNSGSEKTLANGRSRVSKNRGDFDYFKLAAGFVIG